MKLITIAATVCLAMICLNAPAPLADFRNFDTNYFDTNGWRITLKTNNLPSGGIGGGNANLVDVNSSTNLLETRLTTKITAATNDLHTTVEADILNATNGLNTALGAVDATKAGTNDLRALRETNVANVFGGLFIGNGNGVTNIPGSSISSPITTNGSIKIMSPNTGNIILDAEAASSDGLRFGLSGDGSNVELWGGKAGGTGGTNSWGLPINFDGGIAHIGNNFWRDLPLSPYNAELNINFGFGPKNSALVEAWPSGTMGVGSSVQPGVFVKNANPWSGIAYISLLQASTNSTGLILIGQDKDGNNIYIEQFGFELGSIGNAYFPGGTFQGRESQQSPSFQIMNGDGERKSLFFSANATRAGDAGVGQIPAMVVDWHLFGANHPVVRIPKQVINVWMPETNNAAGTPTVNPAWIDLFYVDTTSSEATGITFHANSLIANKQMGIGNGGTLAGALNGTTFGFQVLTNAMFNSDDSAFTFDSSLVMRLGFVKKNGQYPALVAAAGAPLRLGHSSAADLSSAVTGQTITDDAQLDSSGNFNVLKAVNALTMTATNALWLPTNALSTWPATPRVAGDCVVVNSNGWLYTLNSKAGSLTWSKTNLLSTP